MDVVEKRAGSLLVVAAVVAAVMNVVPAGRAVAMPGSQHVRGGRGRISQARFRLDVPDPTAATIACRPW